MKIIIRSEEQKKTAINAILDLPLEPTMQVEIKAHKSTRSINANNLYWKWLTEIKNHVYDTLGQVFTEEDLHDYYRKKFLPVTVKQMGKEEITRLTSTTKLKVSEMSEYMTKIDQFCIEKLELYLPTPEVPDE